jgi:hypothetical protein
MEVDSDTPFGCSYSCQELSDRWIVGEKENRKKSGEAAPDALHRSDSSREIDCADANPAPVP